MKENNGVFEELILGLSSCVTETTRQCHTLLSNRCFWSVGSLRKNNNRFRSRGDFSATLCSLNFINNRKQTKHGLHQTAAEMDVKDDSEAEHNHNWLVESIIEESKSWVLPVKECLIRDDRILINIDRDVGFKAVLGAVYTEGSDYGKQSCQKRVVSVTTDSIPDNLDLSQLRLLLVKELLIQIMVIQGYSVVSKDSSEEDCIRLHITLNPVSKIPDFHSIVCGVVKNSSTCKKESQIRADGYQRLRERDMEEASVHKYGSSVLEASWKGFISSLASSAVKLDLLHSKISQPVTLDMNESVVLNREKSYKGPQFLLYNYARLISILKQFDEKVKQGTYPPLISIDAADFTLLSQEEEWVLLFNFILPYPSLLVHAVDPRSLKFDTHVLIQFLQNLCTCISAYYSRFRILTEPRAHLLPLMYARLYLIMGVKQVMLSVFQLFHIVPVSQM